MRVVAIQQVPVGVQRRRKHTHVCVCVCVCVCFDSVSDSVPAVYTSVDSPGPWVFIAGFVRSTVHRPVMAQSVRSAQNVRQREMSEKTARYVRRNRTFAADNESRQ